jgi:hypothetical protein
MENSRAAVAAILFIVLIVGINFMMYGIVRGVMRGGKNNPMLNMIKAMNPAQQKKDEEMEELHRTLQDLKKDKDNPTGDTE